MRFLQWQIPIEAWLGAFTKVLYDREVAIAERSVKPASILHNASLILGKQIVHILPEGFVEYRPSVASEMLIQLRSAILNPEQLPFCIGSSRLTVNLPIHINQTNPFLIELLRIDLENNANEIITINAREVNRLKKQAEKEHAKNDHLSPRVLQYTVKETGLYRLQRVIDESRLEVQRRISDTLVVGCPSAVVKPAPQDKCKGALSDFYIKVDATPPLKIKYSKTVNKDDHGNVVLSIHPETLVSPLTRQRRSAALISLETPAEIDLSWARTHSIEIPINESLGVSGGWHYIIDEVQDALGNAANYSHVRTVAQHQPRGFKGSHLEQYFQVHERPRAALREYDSQHPMKVERGNSKSLPVELSSTGSGKAEDAPYRLSYLFTPQNAILPDQRQSSAAALKEVLVRDSNQGFEVREPGLYTLHSVSTEFCGGEIMEPSSCLLLNPPEPDVAISAESISDKCAGSSVGLLVDLDLVGTPPFQIVYNIRQRGASIIPKIYEVDRLHTQLELKPTQAGHYVYEFNSISDAVYGTPRSLAHKNLVLEQDVRPPAAARILDAKPKRKACIEEPVTFAIQMRGEPPYKIDYELVYRGRREKYTASDILESIHMITTGPLKDGGEYTLALTSITDQSGCKVSLKDEAKVEVGLQRPRAAFGRSEGKQSILALESRKIGLPLRLQGEAPWTVTYRNNDDIQGHPMQTKLLNGNDYIEITAEGVYEILDIHDVSCPGSVDPASAQFTVRWIPRPSLQIVESPLVEHIRDRFVRKEVCEGDEDVTEFSLAGTAPFDVEYEQRRKPDHGSVSISQKKLSVGLNTGSLRMETSEAGLYEYKFSKLGDTSYNHDNKRFSPLLVQQRVYQRPAASFTESGKTYKCCLEEEAGNEAIPITLTGMPPFHLELEIKHSTSTKPEVINVPNIESNHYRLQISHKLLTLGTHSLTIRKIQDARGCQRNLNSSPPHVQVSVADIPSISPLEEQTDHCVGDRISYTLSGTPPFNVFYSFQDRERKASVSSTQFRRIAEKPGVFTVTALSDQRSTDACKAKTNITKVIHEMPSVRVSKGRTVTVDIHEGGEAEILFEFGGSPPFHFTYVVAVHGVGSLY